jgi:predicted aminopeptidase
MVTAPRRLSALLLSIILSGALSGCGLGYLTQAARGQWQLMRARRPLAEVIADSSSSAELKARLTLVEDAREFASRELGLPDNRSYRTYADLRRPYVVWNVVATPELSIAPLRWCFPVTGCIAYRGYFHEAAARAFAARLARRGDDVLVGGVSAYSTLGHFDDPVLNTMLRYGDLDLVATIFHELAHQLIYVKGDSEFSEAFAMAVEQEGLARWLEARGRAQELGGFLQRQRQQESIVGVFAAGGAQLDRLYHEPLPAADKRLRKRKVLDHLGEEVRALDAQYHTRTLYDEWIADGLNNAHLAAVATYFDCIPGFRRLLAEQYGSLPLFYGAVRKLARAPAAARRALCAR